MKVNKNKDKIFYNLLKSGYYHVSNGYVYNRYGKQLGTVNSKGYVTIGVKHEGKLYILQAHRLIWMKYHGKIPDNLFPNHKDGVKTNNKIKNLELVTETENVQHAFKNKLTQAAFGQKSGNAKLTDEIVVKCRKLRKKGWSYRKLAAKYKISHVTIRSAVIRKTWKHIE